MSPGYSKFQTDGAKYTNALNRDVYNPAFNNSVKRSAKDTDSFTRNLDKWVDFVSWARFYPDLFFDLITPEMGGIQLDLDQRIFLRATARFVSVYCVFPRGWSKTLLQVMGMYHACIFYPDLSVSLTAQTKDNAASVFKEKHIEILKFYPMLDNEIVKARINDDEVEVVFTSGSRIDILANQQSSKGARRRRLNIDEAALLKNALYQDVLEPVTNIPRRTVGRLGLVSPEEVNGQQNFFTTSGFKGTDEHQRNIRMIDEMAELKGKIVLGAGWELACHFGRGETRSQILAKKESVSPIFFAQNYESRWVGATDGALVDIGKVLALRTLPKAELKSDGKSEYVLAVDVARSTKTSNNQSSIAVLKIKRHKNGKVLDVSLPNIVNLPNGLNFGAQAVIVKKLAQVYKAKAVVVDINGVGVGLLDELLKETFDPDTGDSLGCWGTMNTDHEPETSDAEDIMYAITSQGIQHDILINFIDFVEAGKLRLLEKRQNANYDPEDMNYLTSEILPYLQTDFLIEEISNLKLKQNASSKFSLEQVTKRVDKDRSMALAYGLYYIKTNEDSIQEKVEVPPADFFIFSKPMLLRK